MKNIKNFLWSMAGDDKCTLESMVFRTVWDVGIEFVWELQPNYRTVRVFLDADTLDNYDTLSDAIEATKKIATDNPFGKITTANVFQRDVYKYIGKVKFRVDNAHLPFKRDDKWMAADALGEDKINNKGLKLQLGKENYAHFEFGSCLYY